MGADGRHIVVIGGGVIGLCTAYYCARRGHRVTVIDREPAAHEGCSFGNAGLVCPSHVVPLAAPGMVAMGLRMMWNPGSPFYIKPRFDGALFDWGLKFMRAANARHVARSAPVLRDLHMASRACFEELDDDLRDEGGFGLVKQGLLMLCREPHTLDEEGEAAELARSLGVPADVLDAKQTAALDPGAQLDIAGSVHFPKDCHLSPNRFMAALRKRCEAMGVAFKWETAISSLTHRAPRATSVKTSTGDELSADEFVLCAGAWSPTLARDLDLHLPMQAGKGYSLTLPQPRRLPRLCHILTEARVAVTPMGASLRFGGTMEIAGLNETINPLRVNGIIKSSLKYYPEFRVDDFRGIQPWCGLRPCSPDGLPYIGRTRRFSNVSIATGHAMMGLSLGPITGRLMAEVLNGEKPSIDLTLLDPGRYSR